MTDEELDEKISKAIDKKIEELTNLPKQYRKFVVTYAMAKEKDTEILKDFECDIWFEDILSGMPIIVCVDTINDTSVTFPEINLREAYQNFDVTKDFEKFLKAKEEWIKNHRKERMQGVDVQ